MHTELSWAELLTFTDNKWFDMTDAQQKKAYSECAKIVELRALELRWDRLCPPLYRKTMPEQLPKLAKFEEVQKWQYGAMGLLVVGPTRRGKTRSVWNLLKRLHFEERRTIIAFTPMDLKSQVASAWREPAAAEDWIYDLRHGEVLFLDDLDTVKFTEAVEETIYDMFEWRPAHEKPVIATVNRTGPELAARINATGRGAKIVERMREYCQVINFT